MKLVANSVTKTTIWLPFLLLSSTVHEIREKLFPGVKCEIQIREKFSREIKLPRKYHATRLKQMWELWTILFSTLLFSAFASDFNNHAFGDCVNFSVKGGTAPPPPPPRQVRKCPYAYDQRSKTKTNHDSLAQVFPRITSATCIHFKFWLAHCIVLVLCDWPE